MSWKDGPVFMLTVEGHETEAEAAAALVELVDDFMVAVGSLVARRGAQ